MARVMLGGMARSARLVVPGLPHHMTQRRNRCQQTLSGDEEDQGHKNLVAIARPETRNA